MGLDSGQKSKAMHALGQAHRSLPGCSSEVPHMPDMHNIQSWILPTRRRKKKTIPLGKGQLQLKEKKRNRVQREADRDEEKVTGKVSPCWLGGKDGTGTSSNGCHIGESRAHRGGR